MCETQKCQLLHLSLAAVNPLFQLWDISHLSTTLVQTKLSQQLLNGLTFNCQLLIVINDPTDINPDDLVSPALFSSTTGFLLSTEICHAHIRCIALKFRTDICFPLTRN